MATMWSCSCGALNLARTRICDACGIERSGNKTARKATSDEPDRCTWIDTGRRCLMAGSIGTKWPRCGWHYAVASHPRLGQEYEEFERWCLAQVDAPYCSAWTHASPLDLWGAVHGEGEPPQERPCRLSSCNVTRADESRQSRLDPRANARRAHEMAAGLARS